MILFLKKIKNFIFNGIFPPICINCRSSIENQKEFLCKKCSESLLYNDSFFCPECQARIPEIYKFCHPKVKYLLAAATDYKIPAARAIIHYLKYEGFESLAEKISEAMKNYLLKTDISLDNFIFIPIPLFYKKERERGFNQANLIAKNLATNFDLPIYEILRKIKNNKPQAKCKSKEERVENIKDCFVIENPEIIKDKNIILVDDVFTTGSTMNEAVRILKIHGAKKIIVLVFAKA